jgi:hypothetical protein
MASGVLWSLDDLGRQGMDSMAAARRPELLGIKDLPQYASLEEAKKVLECDGVPVGLGHREWARMRDARMHRHLTCIVTAASPADDAFAKNALKDACPAVLLQALGPRKLPTAAAVESELRRLRIEEGGSCGALSDDDEGGCGSGTVAAGSAGSSKGGWEARTGVGSRTILARSSPEYFGFMG